MLVLVAVAETPTPLVLVVVTAVVTGAAGCSCCFCYGLPIPWAGGPVAVVGGRDPGNLGYGHTTYFEITGGVTIKPPTPKPLTALLIRPEVSYDRALTKQFKPFAQNTSPDQWTLGLDLVMEF